MTLVAVSFSQSIPSTYPSLAPTFITFMNMLTGATITPPGISQLAFTGVYMFNASSTTTPFYFLLDGITVNSSTDRYVYGVLGPIQQIDVQLTQLSSTLAAYNATVNANFSTLTSYASTLVAIGTSNVALGTTNVAIGTTITGLFGPGLSLSADILERIGTTASAFGTTSTDPGTLYGYAKRTQEFLEGDQTFNKVSGVWEISTRGGTLLAEKTLSQTSTQVSKS